MLGFREPCCDSEPSDASSMESPAVYRYTSVMHQPNTVRFASITLSFLLAAGPAWSWGREGN